MEKPFKKLFGYRVYLLAPETISEKVYLSEAAKKELAKERMKDLMRLTVYAVGEGTPGVTINAKAGDEVFVDPNAVRRGIFFKIDDKEVVSVSHMDIMHTW